MAAVASADLAHGRRSVGVPLTLVSLGLNLLLGACTGRSVPTSLQWIVCRDVTCSGHGACVVGDDKAPACACEPGYVADGLSCIEQGCLPSAHARQACDQNDLYWYDSCGGREDLAALCCKRGCVAGACVAPDPHASVTCVGADLYWLDSCGAQGNVKETCTRLGCAAGACLHDPWEPIGDSDAGPWSTFITLGSASGKGVRAPGESMSTHTNPTFAVDSTGRPLAAWTLGVSGMLLLRFDNGVWGGMGGSESAPGPFGAAQISFAPRMATARDGSVAVAVGTTSSPTEILVRGFDGTSWQDYAGSGSGGGISNNAGSSSTPCPVMDSQSRPVVAWVDDTAGAQELVVRRFDGTAWVTYPGSTAGGGLSALAPQASPDGWGNLALDGADHPWIVWSAVVGATVQVMVRYNDGSGWVEVAGSASGNGISNSVLGARAPRLALAADDRPIVVWIDGTPPSATLYGRRFDGSAWQELGGSASGGGLATGNVTAARVVVAAQDQPMVAWIDQNMSGTEIRLRRWDGNAWIGLYGSDVSPGLSGSRTGSKTSFELLLDDAGLPAAGWDQDPAAHYTFLRHANGTAWVEYGGTPRTGGLSNTASTDSVLPGLAIDASGRPTVAWLETSMAAPACISVRRFDGTAWQTPNGSAPSGSLGTLTSGSSSHVALALDSVGNPVAAWQDSSTMAVYLERWDGNAWIELDGSASGTGVSGGTISIDSVRSVVVDAQDRVTVAWIRSGGGAVHLRRLDYLGWQELAGSATGSGVATGAPCVGSPILALDGSQEPIVVWACGEVYLAHYNGTAWVAEAGSMTSPGVSNSSGRAENPAVAVGPGDVIYVAWDQGLFGAHEVHLRALVGGTWQELAGSHSAGGLSGSAGDAQLPALAVGALGRPFVAWQDKTSGNFEIYVKAFNGTAWEEHAGSATGGGVSNSLTDSANPSLAIGNGQVCVAWNEVVFNSQEALLRCTRPGAW